MFRPLVASLLLLASSAPAFADASLTQKEKARIIQGALAPIRELYVEPGDIGRIEADLRGRLARGDYRAAATPEAFASQLQEDLRRVSGDPHFRMDYNAGPIGPLPTGSRSAPETDGQRELRLRLEAMLRNNGFARVERLEGNVGLMVMTSVVKADSMVETLAAAMTFLKDTSALLIDLREVRGGDPSGVVHFLSYFVEGRIHAYDFVGRKREDTVQYFTDESVRGPRYAAEKAVLLLTSARTFSGGEALVDAMHTWRYARVVGERTKGGAVASLPVKVTDHFVVGVPFMKTVNLVTGSNWNGVGIAPDVAVPAAEAQDAAYRLALESVAATAADERFREQVRALIQTLKSKS